MLTCGQKISSVFTCKTKSLRFGLWVLLLISFICLPCAIQRLGSAASFVRPAFVYQPHKTASWLKKSSVSVGDLVNSSMMGFHHHGQRPDQCQRQDGISQHNSQATFDLTKEGPFQFLPDYRNPCWRHPQSRRLQCLPYFFLAGFPKCGTTDMYERLCQHPQVVTTIKEPHWLTRTRFGGVTFDQYTSIYGNAISRKNDTHAVVGDGSASTIWDNHKWPLLFGNEWCTEPRIIAADYVRYMNPDVKIIVMLRDPTRRLYSDFMMLGSYNRTQENFHFLVQESIKAFRDCLKNRSLRACVYNISLYPVRLSVGFYSVYLEDWLLRFPRNQMLFVRSEDVHSGMEVMPEVFKFLNLSIPGSNVMQTIAKLKRGNVRLKSRQTPMWNKTRTLLDDFYRSFNVRLAHILQDQRFSWQDAKQ